MSLWVAQSGTIFTWEQHACPETAFAYMQQLREKVDTDVQAGENNPASGCTCPWSRPGAGGVRGVPGAGRSGASGGTKDLTTCDNEWGLLMQWNTTVGACTNYCHAISPTSISGFCSKCWSCTG